MQAAPRGRKTESAEDTPHLSHRPGTSWASLQTRGSFMRSRVPAVTGRVQARARQGGNRKLAYRLVCVPPPPSPPHKSYGLKGLDPHFPNVV